MFVTNYILFRLKRMRFLLLTVTFLLSSLAYAQDFKAIVSGKTMDLSGATLTGTSVYLIQNQITLISSTSDDLGEFILSAAVSSKDPVIVYFAKPGFVSRRYLFDVKDFKVARSTATPVLKFTDSLSIQLMPVNPLVSFNMGDKEYAEKYKWNQNQKLFVNDLAYKKQYNDSLQKRIKDEEGRQLISGFVRKSKEFEQNKNYTIAIQYLDSAAKKATLFGLLDTTIDRKKNSLIAAQILQIKEQAKLKSIDSLFHIGDSLLAILKWKDAEITYNKVLLLEPNSNKVKTKMDRIAILKKEEQDRQAQAKQFQTLRNTAKQQADKKKYTDAIATQRKTDALDLLTQAQKSMVSKSIDSLTVLLKAQNLEGDLKIQLNEIKTLASKGYSPALKVSVDKAVGLLSNIGDATKKKDGNQFIDDQLKILIQKLIQAAYGLHSKTEYDNAIASYNKINEVIVLLIDPILRQNFSLDVQTRIADAQKKKSEDAMKWDMALKTVKDNLDSASFSTNDKIDYVTRLNRVKTALTTEPLKSKSNLPEISKLKDRYAKVSTYFSIANKNDALKINGKDSITALSIAQALLTKTSINEVGNVEVAYLNKRISELKILINPVKPTVAQINRGTVVKSPDGAILVKDSKEAISEMDLTMKIKEQQVFTAWDGVKESVDHTNQVIGENEAIRSQGQQQHFDESKDTRDVVLSNEKDQWASRTDSQVKASDLVATEINQRAADNLLLVENNALAQNNIKDTVDVYVTANSNQNQSSRTNQMAYMDNEKDKRDVIGEDLKEQNLANAEAESQFITSYEASKSSNDIAAQEKMYQAKELVDKQADFVDTRTFEPNYLKDESGNCFTWNKMTELVYKTQNELGFTTSVITRRIVVNAKGYGVIFEKTTSDKGVNSYMLGSQAITEGQWLQYSTGESIFSEGGPITPDCK